MHIEKWIREKKNLLLEVHGFGEMERVRGWMMLAVSNVEGIKVCISVIPSKQRCFHKESAFIQVTHIFDSINA